MTDKGANAGALLLASVGLIFTALGLIGISPTNTAHHQGNVPANVECHQ